MRLQRLQHRFRNIRGAAAAAEFHRLDSIRTDLVERQSIQNKRSLEAPDNELRDLLRRTAADPALTHDYLLKVPMIGSLRRAELLG